MIGLRAADVEHYRPKAACCQSPGSPLTRPGYYWLAYDWSNLLLSCGPCNQRFKRNLFPLTDELRRATCHREDVLDEEPLLIHPAVEDPEEFLAFERARVVAIDGNPRAIATIDICGLDDSDLFEQRLDELKKLQMMADILHVATKLADSVEGQRVVRDAFAYLQRSVSDAGEFAGMARAAVRAGLIDIPDSSPL